VFNSAESTQILAQLKFSSISWTISHAWTRST